MPPWLGLFASPVLKSKILDVTYRRRYVSLKVTEEEMRAELSLREGDLSFHISKPHSSMQKFRLKADL